MAAAHYAIFVDLENCGAKVATLNNIIEKVKIRGDILLGKVYGYTDQYQDLKEVLLSNTFTVVPSLRFGRNQKNNLDIQLVIDALDVAFTNELIDSFCIVSGDSDYTPLVGKLKSMGKFVLGISRSEAASGIFINACNEFQFLESVSQSKSGVNTKSSVDDPLTDVELNKLILTILEEQDDEEEILASELKNVILRLRPDFNEKALGFSTFGKLLTALEQRFRTIRVVSDRYNLIVSLRHDAPPEQKQHITKENYVKAFADQLYAFRDNGFERINPSILKAAIQNEYPDFTERIVGVKRFSDLLRRLEKEGLLKIEMDEMKSMLIHIL